MLESWLLHHSSELLYLGAVPGVGWPPGGYPEIHERVQDFHMLDLSETE